MITEITSTANNKYKHFKALENKKARREFKEFTVEGIKSVSDAIKCGRRILAILVSESFYNTQEFIYPEYINTYIMPDHMIDKLTDTKSPQGIMAVIKMGDSENFFPSKNGAYVYCDGLNDPGNLGTIIRTADAAGFSGVLLSPECVDVYNPKSVRATMGSFFRTDILEGITYNHLLSYKKQGFNIYGGALNSETIDYRDVDYSKGIIIVVGNEANGISKSVLDLCIPVKIPIYGGAESLNAGVAAGILMYEAANNRNKEGVK